jgi:hypothetical protein
MAMECPGSEPAQAARELVMRDRSPNDGESPPSARVRSKFRQSPTSAGLYPPVPQSPQAQPEQTVARAKTSVRTSEDAELVTQCHRLENEVSPGVQGRADPRRDGQEEPQPSRISLAGSGENVNDSLWTGFWRTTPQVRSGHGRFITVPTAFQAPNSPSVMRAQTQAVDFRTATVASVCCIWWPSMNISSARSLPSP